MQTSRAPAAITRTRGERGDGLARHAAAGTLLAPATILFTIFVVLPMLEAGWYSFYRWNGFGWPTSGFSLVPKTVTSTPITSRMPMKA